MNDYVEKNMTLNNKILDYNLWIVYCELFENWEPEHFKQISPSRRSALRANLLQYGVFVPRPDRKTPIYTLLSIVARQEEFHEWTDRDIEDFFEEFSLPMVTSKLRKRLNLTYDGLKQPSQDYNLSRGDYPITPKINASAPRSNYSDPENDKSLPKNTLGVPNQFSPENSPFIFETKQPKFDFSKEINSISKIYTEKQKYSGTDNSSFDWKLNIFYTICKRVGITPDGYNAAFPTMLTGIAEDHYYSSDLPSRTFQEACNHLRQFFEGPEFYRQNLIK
ncbi:hypothetical protein N7495_006970 [Penicillium taxi]|uniref:uncharacterized protein n=1 Tax=Penicillium taxi TaxID=168475 RepID=UPI0025456B44|nr:uncharacterized protein N7495_006970 [Penicillium taxi]KAJ5895279.1 hypothetical protein N7495_006970 [Penicillium taxi]